MKILDFKEKDIEILNKMIFDSSIFLEDIKNIILQVDNTIVLDLERRVLENVKRKKFFFFFERTYFQKKHSQLRFNNVRSFNIIQEKIEQDMSNDFLLDITCNSEFPVLILKTVRHNDILSIEFNQEIQISLIDLNDSEFRQGMCFGKIGFTKEEWKVYRKDIIHYY